MYLKVSNPQNVMRYLLPSEGMKLKATRSGYGIEVSPLSITIEGGKSAGEVLLDEEELKVGQSYRLHLGQVHSMKYHVKLAQGLKLFDAAESIQFVSLYEPGPQVLEAVIKLKKPIAREDIHMRLYVTE